MPVPARLAVALGLLAVALPARPEPGGPGVARSVERIVDSAGTTPPPDERISLMGLCLKPADTAAHDPCGEFRVINGKSWPGTERLQYTAGDQGASAGSTPPRARTRCTCTGSTSMS